MFPVREAELAVKWLFRDRAQDVSLARGGDGLPVTHDARLKQGVTTKTPDAWL